MFGIPTTKQTNLFNIQENTGLNKNLFTFNQKESVSTPTPINNKQLFSFNNLNDSNKSETSAFDKISDNNTYSTFSTFGSYENNKTTEISNTTKNTELIQSTNQKSGGNLFVNRTEEEKVEESNNKNEICYNSKINEVNEISKLKNTIESLKEDILIIKSYTKPEDKKEKEKKNSIIENGIYVKCNAHQHLLKECTIYNLSNIYNNGFSCDICNYKQQSSNEKFYHCNECNSLSGLGNFDLCANCVKNNLI